MPESPEFAAARAQLLRLVEEAGLEWEDLGDVVHEIKSREAAEINNGGLEAQVEYILRACGGDVRWAALAIGIELKD